MNGPKLIMIKPQSSNPAEPPLRREIGHLQILLGCSVILAKRGSACYLFPVMLLI